MRTSNPATMRRSAGLLLLAMLSMTALLAQGNGTARAIDDPPVKPAEDLDASLADPVTTAAPVEAGQPVPWTNDENEPNDTRDTAEDPEQFDTYYFNSVVGGKIQTAGDVDWWAIRVGSSYATHYPVLIDIDAAAFGSPADMAMCLFDDVGTPLRCNDDSDRDQFDPLLFFNVEADRTYYLMVEEFWGKGGDDYTYQIYASTPLLISSETDGRVQGLPYDAGDVLAFSSDRAETSWGFGHGTWHKWVMLLDLSDLGVRGNISSLSAGWRNSSILLLSFEGTTRLPGIDRPVTPWEVVTFDFSHPGGYTDGTFARWWDGADYGLNSSRERIAAIDWAKWSGETRLYVSTRGRATLPTGGTWPPEWLVDNEDVGLATTGTFGNWWQRYFDGSRVRGLHTEKIVAMDVAEQPGSYMSKDDWLLLIIRGRGQVGDNQLRVTQRDIFRIFRALPPEQYHYAEILWSGGEYGWRTNIDAIDYPRLDMHCLSC